MWSRFRKPTVVIDDSLKLHEAGLCLDCQTVFKLARRTCPSCASATYMPLSQAVPSLEPRGAQVLSFSWRKSFLGGDAA